MRARNGKEQMKKKNARKDIQRKIKERNNECKQGPEEEKEERF